MDAALSASLDEHFARFSIQEENQDPLVTTTVKVILIIGALITTTLVILASTSQLLPFSAIGAFVIGVSELSIVTILFFRYRNEYATRNEQLARNFVDNFLQTESPMDHDGTNFSAILSNFSERSEESKEKGKEKEKEGDVAKEIAPRYERALNFENLADATQKDNLYCLPRAEGIKKHEGLSTFMQLPYIGIYSETYPIGSVDLAASLPPDHLPSFPREIQTFLRDIKSPRLFFIVFQDLNRDAGCPRNLILHSLVFPGYSPTLSGTYKINVNVGICRAQGITTTNEVSSNPKKWNLPKTVSIHRGAFSPNNMRFYIPNQEVCSFFMTAKWGDEGVACHFIGHNPKTEEGQKLEKALNKGDLQQFTQCLLENNFMFAKEIGNTLSAI